SAPHWIEARVLDRADDVDQEPGRCGHVCVRGGGSRVLYRLAWFSGAGRVRVGAGDGAGAEKQGERYGMELLPARNEGEVVAHCCCEARPRNRVRKPCLLRRGLG